MSSAAEVRARRMSSADLERVLKIAESLPHAPQWAASAYAAAMDAEHRPRRIALVAECNLPQGLKPSSFFRASIGAVETAPFQSSEGSIGGGEGAPLKGGERSIGGVEASPFQSAERVVGFVVASLVAPEAELETIAVGLEAQRSGVASRLLRALAQELRVERVSSLRLEVRASNLAALGFYRAHGFEQTGQRRRYYADPEEDAVLFELKFG